MKIVKAEEKDISIIREIAAQSWRENYPGIISDEQIEYMLNLMYSEQAINKDLHNINFSYYLVLNETEQAVGILGYEKSYQHNITKLHRIYLLKEVKGKGYGKLAIDFLKKKVSESLDSSIILNVNRGNPALDFYKSQGFTIYKETVTEIGSGFVMDDYLMEYKSE